MKRTRAALNTPEVVESDETDSVASRPIKRGRKKKTGATDSDDSESPPALEPYLMARLQHCPLPDCDSAGHMNGKDPVHITLSGCPHFHNTSAESCRQMYEREERSRREREIQLAALPPIKRGLRRPQLPPVPEVTPTPTSCSTDTEQDPNPECEPALDGLASAYDVMLFRKAQQKTVGSLQSEVREHYRLVPLKENRIRCVVFGEVRMKVWYRSPYPPEIACTPTIYVCEFCLNPVSDPVQYQRHATKCPWRHPPGTEIYRKSNLSFFEVDGKLFKRYCQNLCLFGKLFLDHKTLFQDVEPFLFYVLTKADAKGCRIVGYFSKEKRSLMNYNLSCILTFPHQMRKGYGKMLIDFSYLLSREEQKIGSPERPLSDLGLLTYRNYWTEILVNYLANYTAGEICIRDMSQETCIHVNDIVSTLQFLGLLKYWKGRYLILKDEDIICDHLERFTARPRDSSTCIDPMCLTWRPPSSSTAADAD